uniref:Uncharacterized protein n=1 Tax=Cucumis melo TaxID=3656 RepID=A0A9I9EGC4_CUCME
MPVLRVYVLYLQLSLEIKRTRVESLSNKENPRGKFSYLGVELRVGFRDICQALWQGGLKKDFNE